MLEIALCKIAFCSYKIIICVCAVLYRKLVLKYIENASQAGPVRKAPSNLFTVWVSHSTPIYFLCNCF